jgi:hypothetical protein
MAVSMLRLWLLVVLLDYTCGVLLFVAPAALFSVGTLISGELGLVAKLRFVVELGLAVERRLVVELRVVIRLSLAVELPSTTEVVAAWLIRLLAVWPRPL